MKNNKVNERQELIQLLAIQKKAKMGKHYKEIERLLNSLDTPESEEIRKLTYQYAKRYNDEKVMGILLKREGIANSLGVVWNREFALRSALLKGSGVKFNEIEALFFNETNPLMLRYNFNARETISTDLKFINENFGKFDKALVEQYINRITKGKYVRNDNKDLVAISKKLGRAVAVKTEEYISIYADASFGRVGKVRATLAKAAENGEIRDVLSERGINFTTPLMAAVIEGKSEVVKEILQAAAKAGCLIEVLEAKDVNGKTAMQTAKGIHREDGSAEVIQNQLESSEKSFLEDVVRKLNNAEEINRLPSIKSSPLDHHKAKAIHAFSSVSSWIKPKIVIPDVVKQNFVEHKNHLVQEYGHVRTMMEELIKPRSNDKTAVKVRAEDIATLLVAKIIDEANKGVKDVGSKVKVEDISDAFKEKTAKQIEKILEKPAYKGKDKDIDAVVRSAFIEVSKIDEKKFVRHQLVNQTVTAQR